MTLRERLRHFIRGMGSVMNLAGNYFEPVPMPRTDEEAHQRDADALAGDWRAVGGDLQRAIDEHFACSRPLDPELQRLIDEHFWELVESQPPKSK